MHKIKILPVLGVVLASSIVVGTTLHYQGLLVIDFDISKGKGSLLLDGR